MAYNKSKAEKQWLLWKNAEERKLRELGVDEDTIQRLHIYDWAQFNKERQYRQRQAEWCVSLYDLPAKETEMPIKNAEDLLDTIENTDLLQALIKVDGTTLEAIRLKVMGYSTEQICQQLNITAYAYYNRIKRLKKNLKKILKGD